jgi:hypothetical protein
MLEDVDVLDQLRKLGALRTAGILTQEQYEAKRVELHPFLRLSASYCAGDSLGWVTGPP